MTGSSSPRGVEPVRFLRGCIPRRSLSRLFVVYMGEAMLRRRISCSHRWHARHWTEALEPLEGRLLFSTFMVTNTADAGAGSLRQAIASANSHAGPDTIAFNIAPTDSGFSG